MPVNHLKVSFYQWSLLWKFCCFCIQQASPPVFSIMTKSYPCISMNVLVTCATNCIYKYRPSYVKWKVVHFCLLDKVYTVYLVACASAFVQCAFTFRESAPSQHADRSTSCKTNPGIDDSALDANQYTLLQVRGDGRCLFRCLAIAGCAELQTTPRSRFHNPTDRQLALFEEEVADSIRQMVVSLLKNIRESWIS